MPGKKQHKAPEWCCKMRQKFLLGIVYDHPELPTPTEAVDFIDFSTPKPTIHIKFCPFCGSKVSGQKRISTITDGEVTDISEAGP